MTSILVAAGVGLLVVALSTWRPSVGCALMALTVPLTAGLGRDTLIPVLRPSEALAIAVMAGLLLHRMLRPRPLTFSGLDVAVVAFALGSVVIPVLVLLLTPIRGDFETWRTVMSPLQSLTVYILFSRCEPPTARVRLAMNLMMLASVVVAAVALVELLEPSARPLVAAYYPSKHLPSWDAVYRPTSLLGHFSAVGAFGLINCTLALALAAARVPGFRGAWLSLVILMNICALLASETWAPLIALPAVMALVLVYSRRVPGHLWVVLGVMVVAAALLWPFMSQRIDQQQLFAGGGNGIAVPETMAWRIRYWEEFFVPAAADNLWFGTATTIPSNVPPWIDTFVDNEYLYAIFRAGLPGVALLLGFFVALGVVGWRERVSRVPEARALGAVCLASVIALALMGATSEYLTFAAVSQLFWMLVGLLAAVREPAPAGAGDLIVIEGAVPALRPASLEAIRA